jgi:ketosteroid isomerase-like protein
VGQAAEAWKRVVTVLTTGDVGDVLDLYGANALFLEPYNPPHRGNLLIHSYLKDWMGGKEDVAIDELAVIESPEGDSVGVEWTISYTAAGRRWNALPRATFLRIGDDGHVAYHRDYT